MMLYFTANGRRTDTGGSASVRCTDRSTRHDPINVYRVSYDNPAIIGHRTVTPFPACVVVGPKGDLRHGAKVGHVSVQGRRTTQTFIASRIGSSQRLLPRAFSVIARDEKPFEFQNNSHSTLTLSELRPGKAASLNTHRCVEHQSTEGVRNVGQVVRKT